MAIVSSDLIRLSTVDGKSLAKEHMVMMLKYREQPEVKVSRSWVL